LLREFALQTRGQHLLIEFRGCRGAVLNEPAALQALMERAVEAAQATIVKSVFHTFAAQGATGVVVVKESHFSVHTWPEHGYVAVDVYTCGECHPHRAREVLREGLAATSTEWMLIERGLGLPDGDIRAAAAQFETSAPTVEADDANSTQHAVQPRTANG
jgi:S-adenosylmethionine decarboxylase